MFNYVKQYNKDTYYEYAAYGKAVVFNPEKKYIFSTRRRITRILDSIYDELAEYIKCFDMIHYEQSSDLEYEKITEILEVVFWSCNYKKVLYEARRKNKISFMHLYKIALNITLDTIYKGVFASLYSIESFEKAKEILYSFEEIFDVIVKRALIKEILRKYKEPVILVIDVFEKEYLYKLNSNVKGIIFRHTFDKVESVEFAYAYEIPMVETDKLIKQHDRIIIDNYKGELLVSPEKKIYKVYKATIDQLMIGDKEEAKYTMAQLKYYCPLVDTRRLHLLKGSNFYHGMGMFRSEYIFMVKGIIPTDDELSGILIDIIEAFIDKEVMIRVPDFGEYKILDYLEDTETTIISKRFFGVVNRIFFRSVRKAILKTNRKISLVVPMIRDGDDIALWRKTVNGYFQDLPKHLVPDLGFMLESAPSLERIEEFVKGTDFNVIGLNDFTEEATDFSRYDNITWKDFKEEMFLDVQYTHQHMRRTGIRLRHLISGNMMKDALIFQKFINMGFTNFIVPMTRIRLAEKLILNHEHTRGKFKGVAQKRREAKKRKEEQEK